MNYQELPHLVAANRRKWTILIPEKIRLVIDGFSTNKKAFISEGFVEA